eukprot:COSAG05_NODE_4087_length_1679_cov_1.488608_1_plen_66_part_00
MEAMLKAEAAVHQRRGAALDETTHALELERAEFAKVGKTPVLFHYLCCYRPHYPRICEVEGEFQR